MKIAIPFNVVLCTLFNVREFQMKFPVMLIFQRQANYDYLYIVYNLL